MRGGWDGRAAWGSVGSGVMPSREYLAFAERMAGLPRPPAGETLVEQRARIDRTLGGLPLAAGTIAQPARIGDVPVIGCRPVDLPADAPTIVYLHGGGFRTASALAYRTYGSHLAARCAAHVVVVDYRLAPEHPYPAALDDTVAVYDALAADRSGRRIVVAGDSAGGGLAASLVLRCLAGRRPVPSGVVCTSPWADLRVDAPSFDTNATTDQLFSAEAARQASATYLAGHDPADPLVSPVRGDWHGGPPMLIQVSEAEVLLDDARALAAAARAGGVDVTVQLEPGMPHIWPVSYPAYPEAVAAVEQIAGFVGRVA